MAIRTISEVMSKTLHTINADLPLEQAKRQMYDFGVRHLPVLKGGRCVGILSDRDLKLAYAVESDKAAKLPVGDACQSEVYTVGQSTPLREVAAHMGETGIGSALILDDREKVVGIFTTTDACKALAHELSYNLPRKSPGTV
jgi:acetoin utilization protein AcuB